MPITSVEEIFEHELEDIYFAEEELLGTLDHLEGQLDNQELKQALSDHRETTERHLDRVEQVFEMLGEPPEEETCEGMEGLLEEQREFMTLDPDQAATDLYTLIAVQKTEHYEIAAYGNLAFLANRLDMDEAAQLLHDNLEEEQHFLDDLTRIADNWDFEVIPARPASSGREPEDVKDLVIPTEEEVGKTVVDTQGTEIGLVEDVEGDTMYIEADPSLSARVQAALDWEHRDEDAFPVPPNFVDGINDYVVLDVEQDGDEQNQRSN